MFRKLLFISLISLYIQSAEDINFTHLNEALIDAINLGQDTDLIQSLIRNGADINARDENGDTPLICAVKQNRADIVTMLINAGADVNKETSVIFTLSNIDDDPNLFSPLMHAVLENYENIVKILIDAKADVNFSDDMEGTALMLAVYKRNVNIINMLIKAGADVNKGNELEHTPLTYALGAEDKNITQILINAGADINNALLFAAADSDDSYKNIIKGSIAFGANINTKDKDGQTPLILTVRSAGSVEDVKILIDAGANINETDNDGKTALIYAAINRYVKTVELLMEAKANVNLQDKSGFTALMYSCQNPEIAWRELYDRGGDLINVEERGLEIVKLLVENGANINLKDKEGNTALHYASQSGYRNIVEYLLSLNRSAKHKR